MWEASWSSFSCSGLRSIPHYLCDEMRVEYSVCGRYATEEPRQTLNLGCYDKRINWIQVDIDPSNIFFWLLNAVRHTRIPSMFLSCPTAELENGINNLILSAFKRCHCTSSDVLIEHSERKTCRKELLVNGNSLSRT